MYIKVRVNAGAKKENFVAKGDGEFLISVREPAEQNLANRAVCELIAEHFSVAIKSVRIISGHHSPTKILDVKKDC